MKSKTSERTQPTYPLTDAQVAQLRALEGREPDTADIPPAPDAAWATAVRGKHSEGMRSTVQVRLDGDVLAWLRRKGSGYQGEINRILRERMEAETAG